MNGDGFQMDVTLTKGRIDAEASCPVVLSHYSAENVTPEQSLLPTIRVLRDWLGRWGLFSTLAMRESSLAAEFGGRADFAGLPVPNTVRILGEHLYRLAFPTAVDNLFFELREAARRENEDLRIVLHIQDTTEEDESAWPAVLPWEFMCHPDGYFLSATNQLVFSRFLEDNQPRREIRKTSLPLGILFIDAVPEYKELYEERLAASNLGMELQWDAKKAVVKGMATWDDDVDAQLRNDWDVVHIAAVSRPAGKGRMEMDLPHVAPGHSQDKLVSALTQTPPDNPERKPPRLVVLHLLEANPFDYSATFGGHARALVRAGIPAVLAMQYPMPIKEINTFTKTFYESLTRIEPRTLSIDQALHAARLEVHNRNSSGRERLFGTPVLYLQAADGCMISADVPPGDAGVHARPLGGIGGLAPVRPSRAPAQSETIVEGLMKIVGERIPDGESRNLLLQWLNSVPWPQLGRENARRIIRGQMRDDGQNGAAYEEMLSYLEKRVDDHAR